MIPEYMGDTIRWVNKVLYYIEQKRNMLKTMPKGALNPKMACSKKIY